ncbi:MAG: hypothetical protein WBB50_02675 [Methyloceanibacter sp.]
MNEAACTADMAKSLQRSVAVSDEVVMPGLAPGIQAGPRHSPQRY